jgi:hypothetical protein
LGFIDSITARILSHSANLRVKERSVSTSFSDAVVREDIYLAKVVFQLGKVLHFHGDLVAEGFEALV